MNNNLTDQDFEYFVTITNPVLHNNAILALLKQIGLDKQYKTLLKNDPNRLIDTFLQAKEFSIETGIPKKDREGFKNISKSAKIYLDKNRYDKFIDLLFTVMFNNLADFLKLKERPDFKKLTDTDLLTKYIIPDDIFFQFFLTDTMTKPLYNWKRNKQIIDQSIVCFDVCFESIYSYMENANK